MMKQLPVQVGRVLPKSELRAGLFGAEPKQGEGVEGEEVSPAEDLMREHGVLKRVLLVYGEASGGSN